MLIHLLPIMAARFARAAKAAARACSRRSPRSMLYLDDHLLRDIGLTRADVAACLSSSSHGDPVEVIRLRGPRNERGAPPWPDHVSLAA